MRPVGYSMFSFLGAALLIAATLGSLPILADEDMVDGALWQFGMTPVKGSQPALRGVFRVNGKQLYQKSRRDSKEYDKLIGEKTDFKRKTTYLRIDDMRANEKETRKPHTGIKGKLTLTFDELGEWSGRFVDSEGRHWEFKCKRFQE